VWWWHEKRVEIVREERNELRRKVEGELGESQFFSSQAEEKSRSEPHECLKEKVNHWRFRAQALAEQRTQNEERIEKLESMLGDTDAEPSTSTESPTTSASSDSGASETESTGGVPEPVTFVREGFVDWCHRDGAMTGRYYMFERALSEEGIDATVSLVYHDPSTDGQFQRDRDVSSQEFWMVEVDTELLLFPAPKPDGTFRALRAAYKKTNVPSSLVDVHSIAPAYIEADESGYRLSTTGVLNPDAEDTTSDPS
jgi:hypothetical protein